MAIARLLLIGLCVFATPAWSEIIEVPLPELLGDYPISPTDGGRTTTFVLGQGPLVVNHAWFRCSGTVVVGDAICDDLPVVWPIDFGSTMPPSTLSGWHAGPSSFTMESGAFTWTAEFRPWRHTNTWDFLSDGEGTISFYGIPATFACTLPVELIPPTANVTEAVLVVDADFPLPAASSTWGQIKALYRR